MRRRELQTIQLKLSELKEYEIAKLERAKARQAVCTPNTSASTTDSNILVLPSSSVPTILLANSNVPNTEDEAPQTPKNS